MKDEQKEKEERKEIVVLDMGVPIDELDGPTYICCRTPVMPLR
jgi:hypothetical protein